MELFKLAFEQHWEDVGTKVEMEHTKNTAIARKIAQDHLREDPDYYKDWKNKEKILFQKRASAVDAAEFLEILGRRALTKNLKSPGIKTLIRSGTAVNRLRNMRKKDEPSV